MNETPLITSVEISIATQILSQRTDIARSKLNDLFNAILNRSTNFRNIGKQSGYRIAGYWEMSNSQLSEILGISRTSASSYKEVWHAHNLINLNQENYETSVYENDSIFRRHGSPYAHQIYLSDDLIKLFLAIKNKAEIPEEFFDNFLPHQSYVQRRLRTKDMNRANVRACLTRLHLQSMNVELPKELQLLSDQEKKSRLYKRGDQYNNKIADFKELTPSKRQKKILRTWKSDFLEYLNIYGLEEALKKIKARLKKANYDRKDYALGIVNILNRVGKQNDVLFAVNYIFNKSYMDLFEKVSDSNNYAEAVLTHCSALEDSNLSPSLIKLAFNYWLEKIPLPRDKKSHVKSLLEKTLYKRDKSEEPPIPGDDPPRSIDLGESLDNFPDVHIGYN